MTVFGQIVTPGNIEVADLVVTIFPVNGSPCHVGVSSNGSYIIKGLKPGKARVAVTSKGAGAEIIKNRPVVIPENGRFRLDFDLSTGKVLFKGSVFLDNEPWKNSFFSMEGENGSSLVRIDNKGFFENSDVTPGKYVFYFTLLVDGKPKIIKKSLVIPNRDEFYHEFNLFLE